MNNDDVDDGLGYYSDGVKRTLTDEQVAMFRHSEIYAIQRARQVAKENGDADGGEEEEEEEDEIVEDAEMNEDWEDATDKNKGQAIRYSPIAMQLPAEEGIFNHTDFEAHNPAFEDEDAVQIGNADGEFLVSDFQASGMLGRAKRRPLKGSFSGRDLKRQKRRHVNDDRQNGEDVNSKIRSRGRVRELDISFTEEQVLDYGDGEDMEAEKGVQEIVGEPEPVQPSRPEGRKIWWPVLGAD